MKAIYGKKQTMTSTRGYVHEGYGKKQTMTTVALIERSDGSV